MVGRTFSKVGGAIGLDEMLFVDTEGKWIKFYHSSDCCESVDINDIVGDLSDLIGSPMLIAEEVSDAPDPGKPSEGADSYTWTFYRFATVKGTVTVRWLGESNGYYSESVAIATSEEGRHYAY
jgi:hypothetical protein